MVHVSRALATAVELMALPEGERFHEIIDGELVQKAMPSLKHGETQSIISEELGPYRRRGGPDRPGGWLFVTEVEIELEAHQVFRPDVAGWRRERLPERPEESPVRVPPDWVCEILSRSNSTNDTVKKKRVYHRCRVPHYWIVDPINETLSVLRWGPDGYVHVLDAMAGERVRAEPFEGVEISVAALFGADEDTGA